MSTKTINQFNAITSIDPADQILAWDDSAGTTRKITFANFMTNATLVTPTIASFANATHDHSNAAGGGVLTGYLLATGATPGATSQAQTFTNGINGSTSANGDISIRGTSHATKTSSYVLLQEDGGYVGIGTTTPDFQLTISDTNTRVKIVNTSTGASSSTGFTLRNSETDDTTGQTEWHFFVQKDSAGAATGTSTLQIRKRNTLQTEAVTILRTDASNNLVIQSGFSAGSASNGYVSIGAGSPTALLYLAASTTTRASQRIVAGTRPTSPNTGDLWDDGSLVSYHNSGATNTVVNSLTLERASTGTAAAGFGLGILAQLESSTTDTQSAGRLTWAWSTATHASRAAVGKLTAYYTSTEREVITWVADSSSAKVGINTTPTAALHVVSPTAVGRDDILIQSGAPDLAFYETDAAADNRFWDFIVDGESFSIRAVNDANSAAGTALAIQRTGTTIDSVSMLGTAIGLGTVTSPQALVHGHDGSGGFMIVNRSGVSGTLVTVIPNGAGDVTERAWFAGVVSNSAASFVAQVNETYLDVSSSTTKTDGSNTLTIAVAADGSFTLQATAGAATWKVLLWVFWR